MEQSGWSYTFHSTITFKRKRKRADGPCDIGIQCSMIVAFHSRPEAWWFEHGGDKRRRCSGHPVQAPERASSVEPNRRAAAHKGRGRGRRLPGRGWSRPRKGSNFVPFELAHTRSGPLCRSMDAQPGGRRVCRRPMAH